MEKTTIFAFRIPVRASVLAAAAALCAFGATAFAADWEIAVPAGQTVTLAQATAGIDTSTLAGKRLVKTGPGVFAPGGDVASLGLSSVAVQEGVYMWAAKNQLPVSGGTMAVSVASGATFRVGCDLNAGTDASHVLDLSFAGTGASGEGGAVVFTANSGTSSQCANWTLDADATIYFKGADRQVNLSDTSSNNDGGYNTFTMNGHTLTFKGDHTSGATGSYMRFRYGPTVIAPGPMSFDAVRFTRYPYSNMRVWTDSSKTTRAKIPLVLLVNNTGFNFGDKGNDSMAALVECVECDSGTSIGYQTYTSSSDRPGAFTIEKLSGSPTIGATFQMVTLGNLVARASDILSGDCLVSETNLVFATGTTLTVSDPNHVLAAGTTYTVATAARGFDGEVAPSSDAANPLRVYSIATNATAMTVSFTEPELAADETAIFVPAGETHSWTTATNGMAAGAFAGRKIVKFGTGTLKPQGGVAASGATALVVAQGVAELDTAADAPTNIIVRSGATLQFNTGIHVFGSSAAHPLRVTAEGGGFAGKGAVRFAATSDTSNQWVNWTLGGDAVFCVAANVNLSCRDITGWTDNLWNRFDMGGHSLTFRGDGSSKYVRFRSGPTFVNPGNVVFDGVNMTVYMWASVAVKDANGMSSTIPALMLRNGAFANFANGAARNGVPEPKDVALLFDEIDCEAGTGFKFLGTSSDTAGPVTVAKLVGCPTVSADQALTVRDEFRVRKSDLLAEPANVLASASALVFGSGCVLTLDATDGLSFGGDGIVVATAPQGAISGRPRAAADAGFFVRKDSGASGDCIRLTAGPPATMLYIR